MLIILERLTLAFTALVLGKKTFDVFLPSVNTSRLYSAREIAGILKVKTSEVQQWIEKGELKAKKIGKIQIITGKELLRFLSE